MRSDYVRWGPFTCCFFPCYAAVNRKNSKTGECEMEMRNERKVQWAEINNFRSLEEASFICQYCLFATDCILSIQEAIDWSLVTKMAVWWRFIAKLLLDFSMQNGKLMCGNGFKGCRCRNLCSVHSFNQLRFSYNIHAEIFEYVCLKHASYMPPTISYIS